MQLICGALQPTVSQLKHDLLPISQSSLNNTIRHVLSGFTAQSCTEQCVVDAEWRVWHGIIQISHINGLVGSVFFNL